MSFPRVRLPSRRHLRSRRAGYACLRIVLLLCLGTVASAGATDGPAAAEPTLQLGESRFPELIMHLPEFDKAGNRLPLACGQIRARRIDELDPAWRQAVGRVHLECEPLAATGGGEPEAIATVVTAYLKPGTALFLQAPVVEVRLMAPTSGAIISTCWPRLIRTSSMTCSGTWWRVAKRRPWTRRSFPAATAR